MALNRALARGLIVLWTLGALLGGFVPSSQADDEVFSIDAARRKIRADMQDWRDDRTEIEGSMRFYCAWALVQDSIVPATILGPVVLLRTLPTYLSGVPEQMMALSYSTGERERLLRLLTREVRDRAGALRLFVDLERLLIEVSHRQYEVRLNEHLARAAEDWRERGAEMCSYYQLRTHRNTEFLRAGRRILEAYKQLEKELDHQ